MKGMCGEKKVLSDENHHLDLPPLNRNGSEERRRRRKEGMKVEWVEAIKLR